MLKKQRFSWELCMNASEATQRKQQLDGEKKRADEEKKREEEESQQTVRTANDSVWKSFGFQVSGPKASC